MIARRDPFLFDAKAIIAAETQYYERLWVIPHQMAKEMHAQGKHRPEPTAHFQGALDTEKLIMKKYGKEDLLDLDQFDAGMISGKLSALRWVLGSPWDELST